MTLLTLAEAKAALNITNTTLDSELQDYIDGTVAAVEYICGPTTSTNRTDVISNVRGALVLTKGPVISVTSVVGDLTGTRDMTQMRFDADTSVVRPKAFALPLLPDTYTVVYAYGYASPPVAMKQAAKVILKHQWSTQRAPASRSRGDVDAPPGSANRTMIPGLGFALPNMALQMLAPYDRGPATG